MNCRMLVSDLDGTLFQPGAVLSNQAIDTLKECKKRGILTVIATGRSAWQVKEIFAAHQALEYVDYICGCSSVQMYDVKADTMQSEYELPGSLFSAIQKYYSGMHSVLLVKDKEVFTSRFDLMALALVIKQGFHWKILPKKELNRMSFDRALVVSFPSCISKWADMEPEQFHTIQTHKLFLEVYHPEADKLRGIEVLAAKHHIAKEDIIVFGDDYNDVKMLSDPTMHTVAMANAKEEVLLAARYRAKSNEENGVAVYMKEIFQNMDTLYKKAG